MTTYCAICGQPLPPEEAEKKAFTHVLNQDGRECKKEWRNRMRRLRNSFRVTEEEFALVQQMRRRKGKGTTASTAEAL